MSIYNICYCLGLLPGAVITTFTHSYWMEHIMWYEVVAGKTGWKNEQLAKQRSFEEMSWEQSSSQMTFLQYTTHRKGLNTCLRVQPPLCAPAACRVRRGETYEQDLQQSWANLKEARNSFFGLGVYLSKSKFRIEDKLPFPWYYTTFSTYDQSLFSHWFPSNNYHQCNGNGQPLILNNVEYLEN